MKQIPDDVARLAHEQQLGTPQVRLTITKTGKGRRWSGYALLASVLWLILQFTLFFTLVTDYTPFFSSDFLIPFILLSTSYIPLIISLFLYRKATKICALYPCDKGLILAQAKAKFRVLRWDEIETIWQTGTRLRFIVSLQAQLYTIRCHDGYTLTFRWGRITRLVDDQLDLALSIEKHFTRRHLPFSFADYQAGQTLSFGPLKLNREGIQHKESLLPWEQIARITTFKDRRLLIYKTGEQAEVWANLPAFKIPNLGILLALLKRIRSGQSEQEAGLEALATYGTAATVVQNARKVDVLPNELAALAEEHQLGERRLDQDLGRSRLASWKALIPLLILQLVMLGGASIYLVLFLLEGDSLFRQNIAAIEIILFFIIMSPYIIPQLLRQFRQIHTHLYTFERGMLLQRGKQAPVIWRWEDIETVWRVPAMNMQTRNQSTYIQARLSAQILQLRNGQKYTLTGLNLSQETLSKIIHEQVVPLQLPAAVAAFQSQQTLTFGEVLVNQQGIGTVSRQLPWSQVKSVGIENNRLVIYDIAQSKPWYRKSGRRIPNLFLLFELADYARNLTT
ncbi:MAG TPA: DUF6585 family protein [Ktedonobacteraceae bacterium]|nr:DUF6585 family protein [Ktedonobacteraceae bacterium]